jgi:hypothetical protein
LEYTTIHKNALKEKFKRIWKGRENDEGSVQCLGNGRMCAYEQGPDIIQVFGPPYSSPSLMSLMLIDHSYEVNSEMKASGGVWKHSIHVNGKKKGEMTDFMSANIDCFVRNISANETITMSFIPSPNTIITKNSGLYKSKDIEESFILYAPGGQHIYNDYPLNKKIFFQILLSGNIAMKDSPNGCIVITAIKGKSNIIIIGGNDYPHCYQNAEKVLQTGTDRLLSDTKSYWKKFSNIKHDYKSHLPSMLPKRQLLLDTIEAVAANIKTQQAEEGGVLAGYNYHLGYVRDQYGVFRCLLKHGYHKEARKILEFYWNVWKCFGIIKNAQGLGAPGIFHVHENDDTEITGYLLLQSFKYLEKTKDEDFLLEITPMLEWMFEVQKKQLVNGMLPFNGDETYIAGGMFPRYAMYDGSAEATLLFIEGSRKLIKWCEEKNLWSKDKLNQNILLVEDARKNYKNNFVINGILATNNPTRKKGLELPAFRHGVCEGCLEKEIRSTTYFFGWTVKNENDRYLCPECLVDHKAKRAEDKLYFLKSVSFLPLYIDSDMFGLEEIRVMAEQIANDYKISGKLPSRPDSNYTVGYEYGLFLYTLTELSHPLAEEIYEKMLSILDPTLSWVEYYENGIPFNTRCRPWESGINLEAAINFALKYR